MNLVSFEYIACQKKRSGVLVLSEFAGAAQALGAGALLVNPYNTDEVAGALHEALNMPLTEREQRFDYMYAHINQNTYALRAQPTPPPRPPPDERRPNAPRPPLR